MFGGLVQRGLGSAVVWMWAVTALRLANFIIVMPIALRTIPTESMGIWYLMLNIVGGVTLLEFGMYSAFSRHATFYYAGTGKVSGSTANFEALHGLLRLASTVYSYLAAITFIACLVGGAWMIFSHPASMLHHSALIAFLSLAITATVRMKGLYWNPILFGLQQVTESQRIQFTGIVLSYGVTLIGLLFGAGIVALAIGQCVLLLYPMIRSRHLVRERFPQIFEATPTFLPWKPIWFSTLQTGLILWGGWLSTQGLILICGQTNNLEIAASFSLSFLLVFTVHSLAQSWLTSRYPTMSALWAERRLPELSKLARDRVLLALGTYFVGSIAAWAVTPTLLHFLGSRTPLLPSGQLAVAFLLGGIDLFVASHSTILISCNRFAQMPTVLGVGIAAFGAAFLFGQSHGVWGILLAPIICQTVSSIWIVPLIFRNTLKLST